MTINKPQQVFSYIILKSLAKNKGLHKQANLRSILTGLGIVGGTAAGLGGLGYYLGRKVTKDPTAEAAKEQAKRERERAFFENLSSELESTKKRLDQTIEESWSSVGSNLRRSWRDLLDALLDVRTFHGRLEREKSLVNQEQLEKGLQDLRSGIKTNLQQAALSPDLVRQHGANFGSSFVSSITDPMFRAVRVNPDSISPPLKLLILLGLAGGTFGLGSGLVSRLARAFGSS